MAKIRDGRARVSVGARSSIFAPFKELGLIIIDEEHESTYKQEDYPRYHAREIAQWRSQYHNCPIILGSATPCLESFARAEKGFTRCFHYHIESISKRFLILILSICEKNCHVAIVLCFQMI